MAKFYDNANGAAQASPRDILQNKYNSARANLLIVIAFTLVNIVMLFANSSYYFLFSLFVPFMLVLFGGMLTGNLPGIYEDAELAMIEFLPNSVFVVMATIAAIILAVFVVAWILSKKNKVGWIIACLVFVCLDTVAYLWLGFSGEDIVGSLVDVAFHVWVIVSLANGITAYYKLQTLPAEEEIPDTTGEAVEEAAASSIPTNSSVLRSGYLDEKFRVLLEVEKDGLTVTYRRVKKTNELVINGNVYDEYTALVEGVHVLTAVFANRQIEAGFDGVRSFIKIDGETVAKKLKLV